MMVIRTRKASNSTAADIANPIDFATVSGISMNAEKTEIMMTAAEVTTRAPWEKPVITADWAPTRFWSPIAYSSRIRVTKNTW